MIEIPVELGPRRYVVTIGHGAVARAAELLPQLSGRPLALVSSRRVWGLHGGLVEKALRRIGRFHRFLIPDGERYKSQRTLSTLHGGFLQAGLRRDGVVISLGGGVVGDVAGFAAATYMRGVDWIQLPTTLLAMVDSSIGGKVGVNHPKAKNLVGAFHQPLAVLTEPAFVETLPRKQLRSGAYEILKCGVLGDQGLFEAIHRAPEGLGGWGRMDVESAVSSACRVKVAIVEKDEREAGLRRALNLGHTIGHALEAVTQYRRFTHGEAVGWGLIGAAWISRARGLLAESTFDAIASAVDRIGPRPKVSDLEASAVLEAVGRDKKMHAGRVHFVLPTAIGRCSIQSDVSAAELRRALRVMAGREARLERR